MRGQKRYVHLGDSPVALAAIYRDLRAQAQCSVSYEVVCRRIVKGWSALAALLTPETKRGRAKGCSDARSQKSAA